MLNISFLDFFLELEKLDAYSFLHPFLVLLQGINPHAELGDVTALCFCFTEVGNVVGSRRACFFFGDDEVPAAIRLDVFGRVNFAHD